MEPVELIREGNYVIVVHYDEDAGNPRKEWDNFAKMVCFHRRYDLGDEQPKYMGEWLSAKLREVGLSRDTDAYYDFESELDNDSPSAIQRAFEMLENVMVSMPLYLYNHSGLRISTGSFSCPWDSGQVGFIYADKKDILKEFGGTNLTKDKIAKAIKLMESEVETYDLYLSGQVYGYVVKDINGWASYCEENDIDLDDEGYEFKEFVDDADEIDSCWGHYGYDHKKSGLLENAMNAIEYDMSKEKSHA